MLDPLLNIKIRPHSHVSLAEGGCYLNPFRGTGYIDINSSQLKSSTLYVQSHLDELKIVIGGNPCTDANSYSPISKVIKNNKNHVPYNHTYYQISN